MLGRLPVTAEFGLLAILIGLVIALPVGIYSAVRQADRPRALNHDGVAETRPVGGHGPIQGADTAGQRLGERAAQS